MYFRIVGNICDSLLKLITIKQFWLNGKQIEDIVNFTLTRLSWVDANRTRPVWALPLSLVSVYTIFSVLTWGHGDTNWINSVAINGYNNHEQAWSVTNWWESMMDAGRFNFFLTDLPLNNSVSSWNGNAGFRVISGVDIGLAILAAIGAFQRRVLGLYTDLFILMTILTLYIVAREFAQQVLKMEDLGKFGTKLDEERSRNLRLKKTWVIEIERQNELSKWLEIAEMYSSLKKLAKLVNRIVGINVTCIVSFAILHFAISFDEVFLRSEGRNYGRMVRVSLFYLDHIILLLVAADVPQQVHLS